MRAFELAIQRGFRQIEMDVQLTADGTCVVIHDETVDRTTSGRGSVRRLSFAEIKNLDAGSWFQADSKCLPNNVDDIGDMVRVPSLVEVLERFSGRAHIYLELKSDEETLADNVYSDIISARWVTQHGDLSASQIGLTILSFMPEQLDRSMSLLPNIPHVWLVQSITEANLPTRSDNRSGTIRSMDGIYPRASLITREEVDMARNMGLTVMTWDVSDEADLHRAINAGVTGVIVDWPRRARRLINRCET
jgi:glycerophosphoryl diester phosphodiesterase